MSTVLLFDTFDRRKREFIPLDRGDGKVRIYTCGPTVYDYPHIGNMRAYVFADTLRRILEYNGFAVTQVMNITDVGHLTSDADEGEDKVEVQARKMGRSAWEITRFFTDIFMQNLASLNIRAPHLLCKATDYIHDQIALVKRLENLGYTYRISDGIYFDAAKFPTYGTLARLDVRGIKPGARIKLNPEKRNPTDFALWKFSPQGIKRQMEWASPWGIGFPGWHIECSAIAMRHLGETIDIHTGGVDHIPVHHTNEIAQSEAATGKQFVRYWLHCAFLKVEGQKMSKSLGNVFTLNDLTSRGYDPLAFRYLLLTSRYRSRMNFTWKALEGAGKTLGSLRSYVTEWPPGGEIDHRMAQEFRRRINNDIDTPRAIAHIWENIVKSKGHSPATKRATLLDCDRILGLQLVEGSPKEDGVTEIPDLVRTLVEQREELRTKKRWSEADKVRDKIIAEGYLVEDTASGPSLKKEK